VSFSACPQAEFGVDRWNGLVDRFDEAWLWHRAEFRESVDFRFEQAELSFVVLDEAQRPVALMPVRLTPYRALGIVPARQLRSVGGPALANDLGAKQRTKVISFVHEHVVELARRHNVVDVEVSAPPMAPAHRGERCSRTNPLVWFGFQNTQAQTWVVDLRRPEEAIVKAYSSGTREELNKFRREPLELRADTDGSGAETFYDLLAATFSRRGMNPHPRPYIQHVFDTLVRQGLARVLFLVRDGVVVAGNITAVYKGGAQYWFGASKGERMGGANRALLDRQIMNAKADGAEFFETGQAYPWGDDPALRGISDFKRSFGAELYPLFQGSLIMRPRTHAALQLAALLRHGH
jgi:hypothetical protein